MFNNKYLSTIVIILVTATSGVTQSSHGLRLEGDKSYRAGEYVDAEEAYRKAMDLERDPAVKYNLGNSIYSQGRYEESAEKYMSAIEQISDPDLKAKAYHNLGNALFQSGKLDESIKSYVEALKLQPKDLETKKNLTMALQQVRQQQQQQQQSQQEGQQGEEQEQQQQQPSPEDQQNENEQETAPSDSQQQAEKEQDEREQSQPQNLTREEAEELLKIIENEDQKVQEKLRKAAGKSEKPEKDW